MKTVSMKLSDRRRLCKMMLNLMMGLNGVEQARYTYSAESPSAGETQYEYVIPTPLGDLKVMLATNEDAMYCCFLDVEKAVKVMNPKKLLVGTMNPFSGKYNTYAFGRKTAEEAFAIFAHHLEYVWVVSGHDAPAAFALPPQTRPLKTSTKTA